MEQKLKVKVLTVKEHDLASPIALQAVDILILMSTITLYHQALARELEKSYLLIGVCQDFSDYNMISLWLRRPLFHFEGYCTPFSFSSRTQSVSCSYIIPRLQFQATTLQLLLDWNKTSEVVANVIYHVRLQLVQKDNTLTFDLALQLQAPKYCNGLQVLRQVVISDAMYLQNFYLPLLPRFPLERNQMVAFVPEVENNAKVKYDFGEIVDVVRLVKALTKFDEDRSYQILEIGSGLGKLALQLFTRTLRDTIIGFELNKERHAVMAEAYRLLSKEWQFEKLLTVTPGKIHLRTDDQAKASLQLSEGGALDIPVQVIRESDIVLFNVDIPSAMIQTYCTFFESSMKRGSKLLSYSALPLRQNLFTTPYKLHLQTSWSMAHDFDLRTKK